MILKEFKCRILLQMIVMGFPYLCAYAGGEERETARNLILICFFFFFLVSTWGGGDARKEKGKLNIYFYMLI
jgi:hypothetical protein